MCCTCLRTCVSPPLCLCVSSLGVSLLSLCWISRGGGGHILSPHSPCAGADPPHCNNNSLVNNHKHCFLAETLSLLIGQWTPQWQKNSDKPGNMILLAHFLCSLLMCCRVVSIERLGPGDISTFTQSSVWL